MKNRKEKIITLICILLSSIFVSIPLLKFNCQYDDGIQHIYRLIGTSQSIKDQGLMFSNIMQNLCNGFGYSWNLFYSPLTSYAPLIFRIFGFSFENCIKLFMFFTSIASGYAMYFFMKKILQNKEGITDDKKNLIAILGACLYIFAPYRLNDMYIRVAVAELASFIFIPIVFNGLYSIINGNKRNYVLAFGTIRNDINSYANYILSCNNMSSICNSKYQKNKEKTNNRFSNKCRTSISYYSILYSSTDAKQNVS